MINHYRGFPQKVTTTKLKRKNLVAVSTRILALLASLIFSGINAAIFALAATKKRLEKKRAILHYMALVVIVNKITDRGLAMATVYHRKIGFMKCPKCNGQLQSASFDPDGLHENSVISCVNYCLSGKLKLNDGKSRIEW